MNVPVYSFSASCISGIFFVSFPVHRINSPVANGSKVPACPIFAPPILFRMYLTTSNDVQPKGLFNKMILSSSVSAAKLLLPHTIPVQHHSIPSDLLKIPTELIPFTT
jgi:hypothetical protein